MKIYNRNFLLAAAGLVLSAIALPTSAAPGHLTVQVDRPGVKISPLFNGLMIEDISHSIDGGLYAELIQNRAFNDNADTPVHWSAVQEGGGAGTIALDKVNPVPGTVLTKCLRLDITKAGTGTRVGAANDGYWGMPSFANHTYHASFYAKCAVGTTGILAVGIESSDGKTEQGRPQTVTVSNHWAKYNVTLHLGAATHLTAENRFVISSSQPGTFWLSQVSLMPTAYKNRPNGTRVDIMNTLAGMKPRFLRLPGGNYLEGNTIAERFDWKKTIGDISQRPGHQDPWGYRSTDGFGLLEYLEWCEDLKMQPLLAVFAGYALGGEYVSPGPELAPYVQDALDEIEYVTGGPNTVWGARRIKDGHLAPFPLSYVEVGNEDNFDKSGTYSGRYAQFYDAIKAKYPNLQIIATAPVKGHTDVVDDHYYRSAADMARDSRHYDGYSRTGPKIFVGEWASIEGNPTPTLQAALGDAAWLTGLERNSDIVMMESYAPLLVNVNPGASQWITNLIGLTATGIYNSPSYYMQAMFAANTGDVVLPVTLVQPNNGIAAAAPMPRGKIGLGTWTTQSEYKDIKVTYGGKTLYRKDFSDGATDWALGQGEWKTQDGTLRQMSLATNCQASAGDAQWGDYTYTLKARKISGAEGFLVLFHVENDGTGIWWNIGGWGNVRTALQRMNGGSMRESGSVPMIIENGRWYDIKIEVMGRSIRCSLDGKLITETTDTPPEAPEPLYATASRDLTTGDIILKVVNMGSEPQPIQIDLLGANGVARTATATLLTGEPGDVNSMTSPRKIAPRAMVIKNAGKSFVTTFPAHSVTVVRVGAKK